MSQINRTAVVRTGFLGTPLRRAAALLMASLLCGAAARSETGADLNGPALIAATASAAVATEPATLPVVVRESLLNVPFELPLEALDVVIAERLPEGAAYLPGSSRLNGQKVVDPLVSPTGRLYWRVAGKRTGALSFRVTHAAPLPSLEVPALLVHYPRERQETLQGTFDLKDYAAATPVYSSALDENTGLLKLPQDGSVIRDRDRISVVVEGPLGQTDGATINGEPLPDAAIGQREVNNAAGTERVTYFGIRLRSGVNTLVLGGDRVAVTAAGQIARVEVQAVQALADGSTPVRLRLRTLDEAGVTTSSPTLTVRSSIESSVPDADPSESGYQLRLEGGQGELVFPPQNAPGTLTLEFLVGDHVQRESLVIRPAQGTVGIGAASATLGFSGGKSEFHWDAKGYFEGSVGSGKLYAAANSAGLPFQANANARYPLYGDASSETVPLQGQDPVAFRYDHPDFTAQYRLSATPIDVLPFGETLTALSVTTKGEVRASGFAALISGDQVTGERITPNGTRLLRLAHSDLVPDSETLTLLTQDRVSGQELRRRTLVRNAEYVLDQGTGVVTLASALPGTDDDLNPLLVLAAYRVQNGASNRTLAYGVQANYTTNFGSGNGSGTGSVGVAAVNLAGVVTVGARATVSIPAVSADALAMTSGGGVQLSGTLSGKVAATEFSVRGAYQDAAYTGLAPIPVGLSASGLIREQLQPGLSVSLTGEYTAAGTVSQGNVAARADYRLNAFSVGGGVRYSFGTQNGFSGLLGAGYHAGPLDLDVTHSQPVGGNVDPETVFTAKYAITPQVRLRFTDDLNWNTGQTASFGIDTTLGGTNLSASYDLPNAAGGGNRARFGVDTSLPLQGGFSAGVRGAYTRDMNTGGNDFSVGSDLRYASAGLSATVGGDLAFSGDQWRPVLRGGLTGALSSTFSVTADALGDLSSTPGSRFSLGYAWRDRAWNSLGNVRYQSGSLAGGTPKVTAEINAEYHQPLWSARTGLNARMLLDDPRSLTYQPSVSGLYHLTDSFAFGASMQGLLQPGTGMSAFGLGVEASLRALPGTWVTVGYNALGFDGIGTRFTKPGLYLRLDLLLDEQGGH